MAVTKLVGANVKILKALAGTGIAFWGDSRLRHLRNIYDFSSSIPVIRLSLTPLSEAEETVLYSDFSFHSSLDSIQAVAAVAGRKGLRHGIVLTMDFGDLREGANPEELPTLISAVKEMPELYIYGLAVNPACFSGICPDENSMNDFSSFVSKLELDCGCSFSFVSGGNSALIEWLYGAGETGRINNLRLGESIFLGVETLHRQPIEGLFTDAFVYVAELTELKRKPSRPYGGKIGYNAFGEKPFWGFKGKLDSGDGLMWRGILNTGRQDIVCSGLQPVQNNINIIGASSDCLVVHLPDGKRRVGDELRFRLNYECLLSIMNSDCVEKVFNG
jgi:predicted amino acid racemase